MNVLVTKPAYDAVNSNPDVELRDELVYENDSYTIKVKKGYRCDGGSLPRISWSILGVTPTDPRCVYAFFIHDLLYQSELLSRKKADAILAEVLAIPPSCSAFQRWLIWSHVRMYGWMVWNRHDEDSIAEGRKWGSVTYKGKPIDE